jgi:hypothetical protein
VKTKPIGISTVAEINQLHAEICDAARTTIEKAIRIGELLAQHKASLKHGEWLPWLSGNVEFNERTAQRYMRVFDNRDRLKNDSVSYLADAYKLLASTEEPALSEQELARLTELERIIEFGKSLAMKAMEAMEEENRFDASPEFNQWYEERLQNPTFEFPKDWAEAWTRRLKTIAEFLEFAPVITPAVQACVSIPQAKSIHDWSNALLKVSTEWAVRTERRLGQILNAQQC